MLDSNLAQQNVFIIGDGSVLNLGVIHILNKETDLHISDSTYSDDLAFLKVIKGGQPDVILVCESGQLDSTHIVNLISSQMMAIEILIVVVRLRSNMIDIYTQPVYAAGKLSCNPRRILARTGNDLVNALRRNPHEEQ